MDGTRKGTLAAPSEFGAIGALIIHREDLASYPWQVVRSSWSGEKSYLVRIGNRSAIVAMVFLSVGLVAILVLISSVVLGGAAPVIVGILTAAAIGWLWFGLALLERERR